MKNSFKEKVLSIVSKIKKGHTMTYKEVAEKACSPGASRAVGSIMKANYKESIPCHRVIRSDGSVGEYNRGGPSEKYKKLKAEGALK
jgi:methylated-DNA-[protein]-cysteine S-methyltransferase